MGIPAAWTHSDNKQQNEGNIPLIRKSPAVRSADRSGLADMPDLTLQGCRYLQVPNPLPEHLLALSGGGVFGAAILCG
jgi:hypothetical protein